MAFSQWSWVLMRSLWLGNLNILIPIHLFVKIFIYHFITMEAARNVILECKKECKELLCKQ